jgi:tetratricopeptide (TPR) repeat protein
MDRREELKAKARDHERNEQPEHALEVYLSLAADAPLSGQGGLWTRIGDLQERIGAVPAAVESYGQAVSAFAESGQLNNAVAVSQRILRLDPRHARAHLRLGEISLSQGYREYARFGIGTYARLTAATDRPEDAVEPLAAFLGRFPDDDGLWREWEQELAALGKKPEAPRFLQRLREALVAGGHTEPVERIARELAAIESSNGAGRAGDTPSPDSDESGPADETLPLLDSGQQGDHDAESAVVAPIEGLEPTGGEAYPIDDSGTVDDLPLLGTLPELTTGRVDDLELGRPSRPLAGVERFEFGAEGPTDDSEADSEVSGSIALPTEAASVEDASRPDDPEPSAALPGLSAEPEADEDIADDLPLLVPASSPDEVEAAESTSSGSGFDPIAIAEELSAHAGIDLEFSDAASHYDLGLAYKEMDRFDESLGNLAMAIRGGHDPASVLEVAAEILVRKGEFALADGLLRRIPGVGDHAIPEHLGVHYWLARASEDSGRRDDARHALELVVSVDPGFRDASERLRNLV